MHKDIVINTISEGECFGEEELFAGGGTNRYKHDARYFSVVCISDVGELFTINKGDFIRKIYLEQSCLATLKAIVEQKQLIRDDILSQYG